MVHYRRETERQRACFACHEELVWLRAMQLEAIIEPITFCLVLSFLHSLIFPLSLSFSLLFSTSPSSRSDFNYADLSLCLAKALLHR